MGNTKKDYRIIELYEEMEMLRNIFDEVILVDPIKETLVEIIGNSLKPVDKSCDKVCKIDRDSDGCMCKQIVSTQQNHTQFQFSGAETYYIISRPVRVKNKELIMQITSRVSKNLHLGGGGTNTELVNNIKKYSSAIYKDELTGAYNRKFLRDNIEYILQKSDYDARNVCVGCVDIDNFKKFNDTYGHAFGDEVLKSVTEELRKMAKRKDDYVIRIGGDEFVIIMQDLSKAQFVKLMNDCCANVAALRLKTDKGGFATICISIGCSSTIEDNLKTYEQLSIKADDRLYISKKKGKNCATG